MARAVVVAWGVVGWAIDREGRMLWRVVNMMFAGMLFLAGVAALIFVPHTVENIIISGTIILAGGVLFAITYLE